MGFILFDRAGTCSAESIGRFGPYGFEQYLMMEILSRQEVAANVLDYYARHRDKLRTSLDNYSETQGKGFICWRFLMKQQYQKPAAAGAQAQAQAHGADQSDQLIAD